MTRGLVSEFSKPEHLADPYLGAWHVPGLIEPDLAKDVMDEVNSSGMIEEIRDDPGSKTNQNFRRLIVDFTREHEFPKLEQLGRTIGAFAIVNTKEMFPDVVNYQIDEAAVQIYPEGSLLPLGWHRDHPKDEFLVMSAVLEGDGDIGFTEKTYEEAKKGVEDSEVVATIVTKALDVVNFRANGLYEREDESDIRETHAVTKIYPGIQRFSVQFRMGVNAADYGNTPVNAEAPLRQNRLPLIDLSDI